MNEKQITLFDRDSDTELYKHRITLERIKNELINFGLTSNQSKCLSIWASMVQKQLPR